MFARTIKRDRDILYRFDYWNNGAPAHVNDTRSKLIKYWPIVN